jgi:Ca2+-binding RTX toxin-like protein
MTTMADYEQLMLELVNRARLDPLSEAARYGIDLNDGIPSSQEISAAPKQPLAPNDLLHNAALDHSQWMLSTDTFSHTGQGGSDPGARMSAAGYVFTGAWAWGENIAWQGTTGTINVQQFVLDEHRNLFLSAEHRENTLDGAFREVGVGEQTGTFTSSGTTYNALMTTIDFAKSGSGSFITGVVYDDLDSNDFYSMGEGYSGVSIQSQALGAGSGSSDNAASSGGYSVSANGVGDFKITFSGGGLANSVAAVVSHASDNIKVDLVDGITIKSTADTVLGTNAHNLELLGIEAIDGTGNGQNNVIEGTNHANVLSGLNGNDTLIGGFGSDTLLGGNGNDTLDGGSGNDRLDGGAGADHMAGGAGNDTYVVDNASDVVTENAREGNDTVNSSISYHLTSSVDNLTLLGDGLIDGTGNGQNNVIHGGTRANVLSGLNGNDSLFGDFGWDTLNGGNGNDTLDGGMGNDTLTGGAGADKFIFGARLSGSNVDQVTDFEVGTDTIDLGHTTFTALGAPGALDASEFFLGTTATTATQHIGYDSSDGYLYYDDDGSGADAAIHFATLTAGLALTHADFIVA